MGFKRIYPNIIAQYHKVEPNMKYTHESYSKIVTDEFLRETIPHGSEAYPFRYYPEDIREFDFHCID